MSPCQQRLSIQLYNNSIIQRIIIAVDKNGLFTGLLNMDLYHTSEKGEATAPSISTFFRKWYSFTSPHLFPNDFQNGLRDVCLFAILTMGKGGEKGSYTSTVEDRLRVRRSQRFAAKITL
mmetsp:Transcript_4527/g.7782  ORF Transcript_4527/g.7782 Transcript_4527/m.7782 type:complete len:120 (-) Transcript_4527:54-413(-)